MNFDRSALAVLLALLFIAPCAWAERLYGRVTTIRNGGVLTVVDSQNQQHPIRLANIAAPDLTQHFGKEAQSYLSAMIYGRSVQVVWNKMDRHGQKIAQVALCEPTCIDINLRQVKAGMAWYHAERDDPSASKKEREDYSVAEFEAKIRRFGLWNDKNPQRPSVIKP